MKILSQLCLVFATLLLISCDPDDSNEKEITASVIGEWQLESIVWGTLNEPLDDCDRMQTLTFMENGNIEVYFDDTGNCDFTTRTIFYTLEDNTLSINSPLGGNNDIIYAERNNIQILNANTLKYIEVWNSEDGDLLPEDSSTYTYTRVD